MEHAPEKSSTYCDEPPKQATDRDALLLELRSTGGQTVVPPSVYPADPENGHPTAEPCVWHADGEAARVDTDALRSAVRALASASLLGRHWPSGARHDAALALAGGLLRAGWTDERVEAFVIALCAAAEDREVRDRIAAARSSAERLRNKENATGWPALAKILGTSGDAVVGTVREWLGIRSEPKVPFGESGRGLGTPCAVRKPNAYVPIPAYEAFPTGCLPQPWADFVKQGAAALNCDEALVGLPVLSVLASAVGTTRRVHLGAEWFEPSVLWTCVVQESGGRKSPAAELSVDLVQARQKKYVKEFKDQVKAYQQELEDYKNSGGTNRDDSPEKPNLKRCIVGDVTIEKLSGILDDNRRGVLVYRDELAGWVGSFTRYKGGAGGSDESNWLSINRAGPIIYDRKTGDKTTVYVPFGAASVCGGVQPGTLARLMTAGFFESGLVARILFAMPPRTPKTWTDAGIDEGVKELANKSLDALYGLAAEVDEEGEPCPVVVPLSREARARMKRFVNEWGVRQFEAEGADAAALAKLEALPGRFSLIHHCVTKAASMEDTDPIAVESLEAGIALTEWFAREADRVYRMLSESAEEKDTRRLVDLVTRLVSRNGGRLTVQKLQLANTRKYQTRDAAAADLERLVGLGLGNWETSPAPPGGGRRVTYFVPTGIAPRECDPPTSDDCTTHNHSYGRPEDDPERPHNDRPESPDTPTPKPTGGIDVTCFEDARLVDASPASEEAGVGNVLHCAAPPVATPVGAVSGAQEENSTHPSFRLITTTAGLTDVLTAIKGGGSVVGLDTETTGLDPTAHRVRLIQLATARGTFLIDVFAFPDPREAFGEPFEVLANAGIVGHNLGFDLAFVMRLGFTPGRVCDTMLASQILHAGDIAKRHGLKDVAARVLNLTLDKTEQKSDWSKSLTPDMLAYAARDAEIVLAVWERLKREATAAKLDKVFDIEMGALPAVAWGALKGVGLDRPAWETLAGEAESHRDQRCDQLNALAPSTNLFGTRNWNSTDEVKAAFASIGVVIESTDDDTLAGVQHPLAGLVREYRSAAKLHGTYGTAWLRHVNPDGRVYASWKQIGAGASGRMSCKEPNLQQLPRDVRYRRCFVAPAGRVLVKADYSQIELRVAAKITGDKRMMAAYRDGEDLHTLTARALLGKQEVTKADRQLAKAVNFGLLYGQGAKGLMAYALGSYGVKLTEGEATAHRNTFFRTYPGLRAWHRAVKDGAVDTRTLAGRRRLAVTRYTEKLNTPVQGTGADGLKRALALLWERRSECPDAFPVLFVHDEIVVECDADRQEDVAVWLRRAMLDGMAPLVAPIPVEVELSSGRTWGGDVP